MSYPPPPPPPGSGSFSPRPGQFPPPQPPPGQYPQPGQYSQPGQYPQPGQPGAPGAPGPYPPQQAVVQNLPSLRGRTLLRLSVIFLVVGLAAMITGGALLESKALSKVKGFQRVSISAGTGTVHLSAGNYLAYYEAKGADNLDKNIPLPAVALRSPSGKVMVLDTLYGGASRDSLKLKSHLTYSTDGHDGVAVYQFKAPETGDYQVQVQSTIAASGSDIAFGPSIAKSTAISAIIIVLGVLLFVAGIVLLIIGLVKRRNHKKEIRQHGYVVSLQQPGPPAPYPPPGQNPNPNPGSMYDEQFRPPQ